MASRVGTEPWSCATYDGRGRPLTRTVAAFGAAPARTVSYDWAVGANPLVSSVTDPAGTITTTADLLGRTVSYRDTAANTTTSTYDLPGRLVASAGPDSGWTSAMGYDPAGRPLTQRLDGAVVATATYLNGELAGASYPPLGLGYAGNSTALSSVGRDPAGRLSSLAWTGAGGVALANDTVVRSQSGRVVSQVIDGRAPDTFAL